MFIKKNNLLLLLIFLASASSVLSVRATSKSNLETLSAEEILLASDKARGGGLPGIVWKLDMLTMEPDRDDFQQVFRVEALENYSLATSLFPKRNAGGKLLQVRKNMWYAKPNLRKPISISPRQKLSGPAANGDIASTNYALEYSAELLGIETFNGEEAYVLDLTAKNKWVTYDKIKYWVSKPRLVALKAEFYTVSGKLFKYATFESDNTIEFDSKTFPFVSKMEIVDAIKQGVKSTLTYTDIEIKKLSPLDFSPSVMLE